MKFTYDFIPVGSIVVPSEGIVYLDVGNRLGHGVIDHHHPGAPESCTAQLVLENRDYILSQLKVNGGERTLRIVVHDYPDFDAITSVYFVRFLASGAESLSSFKTLARYVHEVDEGFTRLTPENPVTPYSLFMMHMQQTAESTRGLTGKEMSLEMLSKGLVFIDNLIQLLEHGKSLVETGEYLSVHDYQPEKQAILADREFYIDDLNRAFVFRCTLPFKSGNGGKEVPGLWVSRPRSALFKSWARGDAASAGEGDGFVFTGVQVNEHRCILSVPPDCEVYLKGLGDLLEQKENQKRDLLGLQVTGVNRPGYNSPDPWYDGRSSLHNYTIIDSPRAGTLLSEQEIRETFEEFLQMI